MTSPPPRRVRIEHAYPAADSFLAAHGYQGLAPLHVLVQNAEFDGGAIVATGSSRSLAAQSGLGSRDTVYRRIQLLTQAGVLERVRSRESRWPVYLVRVEHLGITVTVVDEQL